MNMKRGDYCKFYERCMIDNRITKDNHDKCLKCKSFDPVFLNHDPLNFVVKTKKVKPKKEIKVKMKTQKKRGERNTKLCIECGLTKAYTGFYKADSSPDGLSDICRKCTMAKSKKQVQQDDVAPKTKPSGGLVPCSICGEKKPLTKEYFTENKTSLTGFYSMCKVCRNNKKRDREGKAADKIVLDFRNDPETLEKVKQWSADQMRDPAMQILFSLKYDVLAKRKTA